ncbi:MAG: hypothetical protein ABEJ23_01470 [Haloarculaceae archaeon]
MFNSREIVAFEIEEAVEVIRERARDPVFAVVEYDADDFNVLYASDLTVANYEDEAAMLDHFQRIHDYVNVDFAEIDLFVNSLFPAAERVDYLTTRMDHLKLVRVYDGRQGVLLGVAPDEPVEPLVEPLFDAMGVAQ